MRAERQDLATNPAGFHKAEYLTPRELALALNVSLRTIARWHALHVGPPRISIGHLVLYRVSAVEDWLRQNEVGERP
jgi:hypothetical protein